MPPTRRASTVRPAVGAPSWATAGIPTFEDDGTPISPTQPIRTSGTSTGPRSVGFAIADESNNSGASAPSALILGTANGRSTSPGGQPTQPSALLDDADDADDDQLDGKLNTKASTVGLGAKRSAAELYAMSSFKKTRIPQHHTDQDSSDDDMHAHSTRSDNSDMSAVSMATSTRSGQAAKAAGATTLRCGGLKIRVPFTAWTFLAMLVPIGLLVAVLSMKVAATADELTVVSEHKALATAVGECSSWLMRERGTMGPWMARGSDADWTNLQRVRAGGDAACAGLLQELQALAGGDESWRGEVRERVVFAAQQAQWRERVDTRTANGRAAREFFTAAIAEAGGLLIRVADELRQSARTFTELQLLIGSRNYIGLARGVGNAIAASDPNATTGSSAVVHEYIAGHAQAKLGFGVLRGAAGVALRTDLDAWQSSEAAVRMWLLLDTMADVSNGGVRSIQQNNATEWWAVVSAGLDALYAVEQAHLQRLHDADAARAEVRDSALIMGCGVFACLAAAGLLAWRQTQVRHQLEDQVARMTKTKKAVSAFVPRFFLQKMGYTSITQVRAGESTNVALAMLFSDIRRFTTVSEGMESSELFDWIQGYFQRMTTIVEGRRGNVNQFVGDAMFAVFGTCNDALECAVDMQADVQQLNVQRLCADSTIIPIEVGVGIHHDVVALGILGDSKRHTCTAISASVNLASRLEGLTKQLGCKIIASEAVVGQLSAAEASRLRLRRLGPAVVKGAIAAAIIYDVYQTDDRALQQYKAATEADVAALIDEILDGSAPDDTAKLLVAASEASAGKPWHSFTIAPESDAGSSETSSSPSGDHPSRADAHPADDVMPNSVPTMTPTAPSPSHEPATDHPADTSSSAHGAAFALAHIAAGCSAQRPAAVAANPRIASICAAFAKYGVTDVPLLTIASMSHNHGALQFVSK